jgi:hypothetical protein
MAPREVRSANARFAIHPGNENLDKWKSRQAAAEANVQESGVPSCLSRVDTAECQALKAGAPVGDGY